MTSQLLEHCIGITNSFKLMELWNRAEQITSGNKFTLSKSINKLDCFRKLCYNNGFDDRHVKMYLKLKD